MSTPHSTPDDRTPDSNFPNNSHNVHGTEIEDVPAHPSVTPPVDSRKDKPVDSRIPPNIPENSRT